MSNQSNDKGPPASPTKRVVILAPHDPATSSGGVEHFVSELEKGLRSRGYEVEILCRENSLPKWWLNRKGAIARSFGDAALSWYEGRKLRTSGKNGVVAVISQAWVGWHVPQPARSSARLIHMYHGTYRAQADAIRPCISGLGYWKQVLWDSMLLERWSGKRKQVLFCSNQARDEVARYFGYSGTTVWNPLDTSHFRPRNQGECRAALGLPGEGTVALFVGNLHPMKGFATVRMLIRELMGVQWLLAIRGELPADLAEFPNVKVFRDVPHERMPLVYGAADFTVAPSLYEAFPYAVTEPLACGTPVIASVNGASSAFLTEPPLDRLLIGDAGDAQAFLAAARDVVADPLIYRKAVTENVRPRIEALLSPENWWARFSEVTGL